MGKESIFLVSMLRRSTKYGLVAAAFAIGIFFMTMLLGESPFLDPNQLVIDIVLFSIFVGFAAREYKSLEKGGYLHFWEGMSIGFLVYSIAILTFVLSLYVYFFIQPEALQDYESAALAYYEMKRETFEREFGKDMYQSALEDVRNVTVSQLIWGAALKKLFAAFLVTPVMSIILRKKPK